MEKQNVIKKDMNYNEMVNLLLNTFQEDIKGFSLVTDPSGSLNWINQNDFNKVVEVYATPNWVENGELKIEIYFNEDLVKEKVIKFSRLKLSKYQQIVEKEFDRYSKKYLS